MRFDIWIPYAVYTHLPYAVYTHLMNEPALCRVMYQLTSKQVTSCYGAWRMHTVHVSPHHGPLPPSPSPSRHAPAPAAPPTCRNSDTLTRLSWKKRSSVWRSRDSAPGRRGLGAGAGEGANAGHMQDTRRTHAGRAMHACSCYLRASRHTMDNTVDQHMHTGPRQARIHTRDTNMYTWIPLSPY